MILLLAAFFSLVFNAHSFALEIPPLQAGLNDFAGMFPPASADDLKARLHRFNTEIGATIVVLTVKSLDGEDMQRFSRTEFKLLPLSETELAKSVLLVVARKEHLVSFQAGAGLSQLLPEPMASQKLQAQVALYWDGLRPDLGILSAVYYLERVIRGDVRIGSQTETEKLQETSLHGSEAGAIFAVCLGPFLAFFVGGLWGIYATHYGVQRWTRLLMGAIFGGATAKIVGMLFSLLGNYSDNLWYFIMALAIPLGVFGSLTEFWMFGDWRGIPRVKDRPRKPEDNMGI
jgi:uncharacterized membrane protein YgcG